MIGWPYMFYEVDAGDKRDVVGVEAEDSEALDDGLQLLHPLPVDRTLLSRIASDVEEFSKSRQKLLRQSIERWSSLLKKMLNGWEAEYDVLFQTSKTMHDYARAFTSNSLSKDSAI